MLAPLAGFYTIRLIRGMAVVPPMAYHGIPTASHGVAKDSMAPWGVPWQAMGGTMATPAATATALYEAYPAGEELRTNTTSHIDGNSVVREPLPVA